MVALRLQAGAYADKRNQGLRQARAFAATVVRTFHGNDNADFGVALALLDRELTAMFHDA